MTAPSPYVSLLPQQSGWMLPPPSVFGLSDDEQRLINGLAVKLTSQVPHMLTRWAYYDGEQRLANLGISIPPQLAGIRTVVDWPRICVDPLVQRAEVAGFRLPGSTEIDAELAEYWDANDMQGEFPLTILDSLVAGRGYMVVGSPDVPGDAPVATVESPLNMTVTFDARTRRIVNGYQAFEVEGMFTAVLYLPNETVFMSRQDGGANWSVYHRDQHQFGEPPIVRLPNRARSSDREGRSQITNAVMNTTDAACRALLGMDIAREVYSIPRLAILGAAEDAFVDAAGVSKSAIDMAMTRVLALERDEDGQLPAISQLAAFDPAVFTKIVDKHARLMSSFTGFPADYFGESAASNPASADAIRVSLNQLDRSGGQVQKQATPHVRKFMQLLWRFANRAETLPSELRRLEVDWVDAKTPTPAATSDAVTKQIAAGAIPATSDVTLAELGYSPLQRARLAQDREQDPAWQLLQELGTSVAAKDVISALRLLKATGQPTPAPSASPAPDVPVQPGTQSGR